MTHQKANLNHPFLAPLKEIADAPKELWQIGKLPDRTERVVSIVGSRNCTPYGRKLAYQIAYELAKLGYIIVSGLAYGIDAQAHHGCLDAGGTTVAVLGTPINRIHPLSNANLAEQILDKGAILSEYAPNTETKKWHFLKRNRIVSGLCDGLIIVEASLRSGTFTTASQASTQGKEVFAVPGDLGHPKSAGCNKLISATTAHIYTSLEDFLKIIPPLDKTKHPYQTPRQNHLTRLSPVAAAIVNQLQSGISNGDDIIKNLSLSPSIFNQNITLLELRDIVVPQGCNTWLLAP